jgi:hypothetical protein
MESVIRFNHGNSLASEMKRLGIDHPDKGYVSAYTRGLNDAQKKNLRAEFRDTLKKRQRVCQLTGSSIALVASHIKPFDHCVNRDEATNEANGLLLRKDIDYLFDKGYISFDKKHKLIISHAITKAVSTENWAKQIEIAIGHEALKSWASGGNKCMVNTIGIPTKDNHWSIRRRYITLSKMRDEYMDYHRRHVFKNPQIQHIANEG